MENKEWYDYFGELFEGLGSPTVWIVAIVLATWVVAMCLTLTGR